MTSAYDVIYQKLTPDGKAELAKNRTNFEALISEIQRRNPESVDLMKLLAAYSQTRFEGMSEKLISQAAKSYQQSAGKRKKTYKRSSTKKSKSRRNKTRK